MLLKHPSRPTMAHTGYDDNTLLEMQVHDGLLIETGSSPVLEGHSNKMKGIVTGYSRLHRKVRMRNIHSNIH